MYILCDFPKLAAKWPQLQTSTGTRGEGESRVDLDSFWQEIERSRVELIAEGMTG
jgi:hypothetical protein